MYVADSHFTSPLARKDEPRRWLAVVLALLLTPGLGFLHLQHLRLAGYYFLYAFACLALFAFLFFLDLDYLRNMPYAFFYALMVNIAGCLHVASVPPRPPQKIVKHWYSSLLAVLSVPVLVAMLIYSVLTVAPTYRMPNPSMEPTLALTKPFLVLLPAYRWLEPQRGELILYRSISDVGEISRVSRIIGLPGDSIAMKDGYPVLNGVPLARMRLEDYPLREGARLTDVPCLMETLPDGRTFSILKQDLGHSGRYDNHPAYTVPAGSYFVISDNRDSARDSRDMRGVGFVPKEKIEGRVIALQITPDSRLHWLERWHMLQSLLGF